MEGWINSIKKRFLYLPAYLYLSDAAEFIGFIHRWKKKIFVPSPDTESISK